MRCIELRQKTLLLLLKSDLKFNKTLVLKLFFKTIEKGISSTYILSEINELPRKGVSGENLIEAVNKASASEEKQIATQSKAKIKANKEYETAVSEDFTTFKLWYVVKSLTKPLCSLR